MKKVKNGEAQTFSETHKKIPASPDYKHNVWYDENGEESLHQEWLTETTKIAKEHQKKTGSNVYSPCILKL